MAPTLRTGSPPTPQLDRYFDVAWYQWQHPEARAGDGLTHFLESGAFRGYDPSPFVDMAKVLDAWGMQSDPVGAYHRLCRRGALSSEGVYDSVDDLRLAQRRFRHAIGDGVLTRSVPPEDRRTNLVFLQNRHSPRLHTWMADRDRTFDVWVNFYDASAFQPWAGDWVSSQVGTKFTAIASYHRQYPEIFAAYDYVWLLDDDIDLTGDQIDAAFRAANTASADLAQPSLSHDSHCMWPVLFSRLRSRWRAVSTVEIMMPIYSRRLAATAFPEYRRSVSGFGLDLLSGKLCDQAGGRAVVIDEVVARHGQAIDQSGGEYYQFLRRNDINANAELWALAQEFDLPLGIEAVQREP